MLAKELKIKHLKEQREIIEKGLIRSKGCYIYVGEIFPENIEYFESQGFEVSIIAVEMLEALRGGKTTWLISIDSELKLSEEEMKQAEEYVKEETSAANALADFLKSLVPSCAKDDQNETDESFDIDEEFNSVSDEEVNSVSDEEAVSAKEELLNVLGGLKRAGGIGLSKLGKVANAFKQTVKEKLESEDEKDIPDNPEVNPDVEPDENVSPKDILERFINFLENMKEEGTSEDEEEKPSQDIKNTEDLETQE